MTEFWQKNVILTQLPGHSQYPDLETFSTLQATDQQYYTPVLHLWGISPGTQ